MKTIQHELLVPVYVCARVRVRARCTRALHPRTAPAYRACSAHAPACRSAAKFSPNNRYLLVSTLDGRIRLWDYLTSRSVKTFTGHTNTKYACTSAFSITSTRPVCVSGSDNGTVHVWDVSSRDMVAALNAAAPSTTSGSPVPPSPVPGTMEVDVPGTVMQGSAADEPVLCVDAHPTEDVIFASYQGSVQAWAGPAFCPPSPA